MFSFGKFKNPLGNADDMREAAYRAHNTYGPKVWYKKAKAFIFRQKTGEDTESSSTPSSGQEETVKKRLVVRDFSDTRNLGKEEAKRLGEGTAHSFVLITRFLWGLGMIQIFHFLLTYQTRWDPINAALWFGFIGFYVATAMAFSRAVRAIGFLMLPVFCTSSGRAILISYAMMMLLTGPINNISHNYGEISRSLTCGNELGFNITQGLRTKIQEKQFEILDTMDNTIDVIINAVERAKATYENVAAKLESIASAIRKINNYVGVAAVICEKDSASYICNLPGNIAKNMKKLVTDPVKNSLQMMRRLFFFGVHFDHEFEFHMNTSKSAKQIRDDILKEVKGKFGYINDILYWTRFITIFSSFIVVAKAAMYRKKYLTRNDFDNCYITAQFKHLDRKCAKHGRPVILPLRYKESRKFISPKRCAMSRAELKKCFRGWLFVTSNLVWSLFMMLIDWSLYSMMVMVTGTLSMKSTSLVEDLMAASEKSDAFSRNTEMLGAFFTLNVFGRGLVPAIYRAVVRALQQVTKKEGLDINMDKCLPRPSVPDFFSYLVIYCILQTCYILVYIQAYMLRLRRYIMAKYYPVRERNRIMYLRRKILNNRGIGNVEDLKRTLRDASDTIETNQAKKRKTLYQRLIMWSNRRGIKGKLARLLTGRDKHRCTLCMFSGSRNDDDLFTKCQRPGCSIEYCKPCFEDLHRICPSCLMRHSEEKQKIRRLSRILGIEPVSSERKEKGEFGDMAEDFVPSSGISDSSDDEKKGKEELLGNEEYIAKLQQEANERLQELNIANTNNQDADISRVNEGAGTSGLNQHNALPTVEEEIVDATQATENMAWYSPKRSKSVTKRIKQKDRSKARYSAKLAPKRSQSEERGLLEDDDSDYEYDFR
uniref:DC-STAMP domain-containing protein 2-like isoform X1 n=1 Tax=Styela clava TaxID=7725 RepID=UPI001939E36A|nr:DC-STAMP domain-containing protein 2-like isoform X1 [Styela clava]